MASKQRHPVTYMGKEIKLSWDPFQEQHIMPEESGVTFKYSRTENEPGISYLAKLTSKYKGHTKKTIVNMNELLLPGMME